MASGGETVTITRPAEFCAPAANEPHVPEPDLDCDEQIARLFNLQ
jgi:hypothetical protein